jgi:hypothetical protein
LQHQSFGLLAVIPSMGRLPFTVRTPAYVASGNEEE